MSVPADTLPADPAVLVPASVAEAVDHVRAHARLQIVGAGTRSGFGRPVANAQPLSTRALSGITLYEPAEMVIAAKAGTPLSDLEALLAKNNQRLAFEPRHDTALYGTTGATTLGALAAGNISGPRRIAGGACRDSLIGLKFINGLGEEITTGGRVMKNVTGLDLVKFLSGAWGTLGLLTEVSFRVVPGVEGTQTLVLSGLDEAQALEALGAALATPFDVSGAAHAPAGIMGEAAQTFLRIEGFADQIAYRREALRTRLKAFGPLDEVAAMADPWAKIRDCVPLAQKRDLALWKLVVRPDRAAQAMAEIRAQRKAEALYDWGGGLVWLATPQTGEAGATVVRAAAQRAQGHATLIRASAELRARVPVFTPEAPALAAITRRAKSAFDPMGKFNPGLMFAEFDL